MVSTVELHVVQPVEVVRVPDPEDPLAAVEVPVVRALDLRDDPLLLGVDVEPVVKRLVLEAVARDLGRGVRPVVEVGPVLGRGRGRAGRLDSAQGAQHQQGLEERTMRHVPPPCRDGTPTHARVWHPLRGEVGGAAEISPRRSRVLRAVWAGLVVAILTPCAPAAEPAPAPELSRLKAHVETLASPEFGGRRGRGALKAAKYVADALRDLGLEPLFGDSFAQDIPGNEPDVILGRNVGARLRGSDPALKDEWIILGAHFDHLGTRDGVLYPGADDDASGVAMMLEVARSLSQGAERPRRGVLFVGFDLEESALYGSRHFAARPPVPLEQVKLFVTADMIGRSLGGVCEPYVFAMGTENAPALRPWIAEAAAGFPALKVGQLGADIMVIDRSDYGPFRSRRVPFLFFSTGENPCYHTPRDVPETLDYPKLESISRLMHAVLARAAVADALPAWSAAPDHTAIAEAMAIRDVLRTFLDHRADLQIGAGKALILSNAVRNLDAVIARGAITPEERSAMVRIAQLVLFTVL